MLADLPHTSCSRCLRGKGVGGQVDPSRSRLSLRSSASLVEEEKKKEGKAAALEAVLLHTAYVAWVECKREKRKAKIPEQLPRTGDRARPLAIRRGKKEGRGRKGGGRPMLSSIWRTAFTRTSRGEGEKKRGGEERDSIASTLRKFALNDREQEAGERKEKRGGNARRESRISADLIDRQFRGNFKKGSHVW